MSKKRKKQIDIAPDATAHDIAKWREALREEHARAKAALHTYRPLKYQEKFHSCTARECLVLKGNRAGGSIAGFVEDARAVMGCDPHGKYPSEGTLVCIGFGQEHIGTVIYRHLFEPGLWKIIKDRHTGEWRPFRPWEPDQKRMGMSGDFGREDEQQPSPPLIPEKYIEEDFAWDNKRNHEFSRVRIKTANTDWIIRAYNSNGDPRQMQGFNVHLLHIDEDVADAGWYYEGIARTNAVRGLFRWTAMKHLENEVMNILEERAEDEAQDENPRTVMITANPDDNPYYSEKDKENDKKLWMSMGEDVFMQRWHGKASTGKIRVYPNFSPDLHTAITESGAASPVQKELKKHVFYDEHERLVGNPPLEWARYASLDPGHDVFAVTFYAVPPPDIGDQVVLYDELYIRQCDAQMFGDLFRQKCADVTFQDIIIDAHGARLRDLGSGKLPRHEYSAQLRKHGIKSVDSGYDFRDGLDNPAAREVILRDWLTIREDGTPKLIVIPDRCPEFCREMIRFYKKRQKIGGQLVVKDEGDRRRNTHAVETCEYAVSHGLPYVAPPKRQKKSKWVDHVLKGRRERAARRKANSTSGGRQGIVLGARGA